MANISKHPDYILLTIVIILILLGIIILASVSAPFSQEKFGSTFYLLKHQLLFGLLPGLILAFIVYKINLFFLKKWFFILLIANLILMAMVFLPIIGSNKGGASRWIGSESISFQPAELLKITFILYLAAWLSAKTDKPTGPQKAGRFSQTFFAFLIIIGIISLLLILQPNVSTLIIIVFIAILMYFSAKTSIWHTFSIVSLGFLGMLILMKIEPYRANRLMVFLNPEVQPMGIGYQAKQALIAIGSGGITGVGLGMSLQKLGFLPQSIADSIFAVFSEETGFIGALFLIFLFLMFLLRGFKIAKESQNKFSQLVAIGITSWIVIQAFVNIGAMIGILPLTGIPLPLISYGGSALIIELIGIGILLNISKHI